MVFGDLSEAPPIFMVPFVLGAGAILSRDKVEFGWLSVALVVVLTFVFAASMVRFTFVAAIAAGVVLGFVSSRPIRRLIFVSGSAFVIMVAVGQIARPSTAMLYINFVAQTLGVGSSSFRPGWPRTHRQSARQSTRTTQSRFARRFIRNGCG